MLAEGLLVAGELDQARGNLLESAHLRLRSSTLARSVRKRTLRLARVAHAQGEAAEAIDQLETASKMDAGNITILKTLAELAGETGQHDRAERAYRTLLMSGAAREGPPGKLPIGPTEVLFNLSRIAADNGVSSDKADELVESPFSSRSSQHDFEGPRIQRKLARPQRARPCSCAFSSTASPT